MRRDCWISIDIPVFLPQGVVVSLALCNLDDNDDIISDQFLNNFFCFFSS